jgi:hypothetical protein
MNKRVVYLAAPASTWDSDRYEKYFYLVGHHFSTCELLEAREVRADWAAVLDRVDVVVFLRNTDKAVDKPTWEEIDEARDRGMDVYMCVTDREDNLVLIEWDELKCTLLKGEGNYARIKSTMKAEVPA